MKSLARVVVALAALIGAASGCSEPTQSGGVVPPSAPNTAPKAIAGPDLFVLLPSGVVLSGYATDSESWIASYSWKKSAGPESYSIESPSSMRTRVANLAQGRYEFELTATDRGGLTGRDTVAVSVYDPDNPSVTELAFKNMRWQCPWGCSLRIETLYVAAGAQVGVFLRSAQGGDWVEAKPAKDAGAGSKFVYTFGENNIWVYSNSDETGEAQVKIMLYAQNRQPFTGGGNRVRW